MEQAQLHSMSDALIYFLFRAKEVMVSGPLRLQGKLRKNKKIFDNFKNFIESYNI